MKDNSAKSANAKKAFTLAIGFMVFHTVMSLFRGQLGFMIPPLMTTIVEDLGITLAQGGLLQTTATLVMGIGMVFGSILIDKIGTSKTLALSLVSMALAGIIGFFATSYSVLLTARFFMGLCNALSYPAALTIIAERFLEQKQRGMAMSVVQATNSLSTTLAFALTVPITMALASWNNVMLLWGVVGLGLAVVFTIADIKPSKFFAQRNAEIAKQNAPAEAAPVAAKEPVGASLIAALKKRPVISGVISFTGATWLYMIFNIYLPTILQTVHGLSPAEAGSTTSLINFAGIISCLICGLFLGKIKNFKPFIIILMVLLPVSGVAAMFVQPGIMLSLCMIGIGISFFCYVPIINTAVVMAPGMTPKILAAGNALWTLLGNVLTMLIPIWFDSLQQSFGMTTAVLILCLGGVFSVIGALMFPGKEKA